MSLNYLYLHTASCFDLYHLHVRFVTTSIQSFLKTVLDIFIPILLAVPRVETAANVC